MLKPAPADLAATLWLLKSGAAANGIAPQLPRPGLTSVATDPATPDALYRAHGFHVCGPRAVRLDILERLADLIRPLLAWRSSPERADAPPKGSTGDGGFKATDDMMSILGCSAEELGEVLKSLGFRLDRRPIASAPPIASEAVAEAAPADEPGTAVAEPATSEVSEPSAAATEPNAPSTESANTAETPIATEESAAPAEAEKFEDVWRPRRHPRREGPRRDGNREGRHHRGKPREERGAPANTPAIAGDAPAVAAEGHEAEKKPDQKPDHGRDRRGDRGQRFENRGSEGRSADHAARKDEGGRPRRDHEKRNRQGDNRHGEGRRRDEPRRSPQMISAAPPKSAPADSSSPFAALAALKAQMEKRSEGSGST
jgi:ATP-dependent RNA helicase SUPV3L1/SUV3